MSGAADPRDLTPAELLDQLAQASERLRRLQDVGNHLATALSTDDVVDAVMTALQPPQSASARMLWLLDDSGQQLELARHAGTDQRAAELFATIDVDSSLPGAVACRERRTVISPSRDDTVERFPELEGAPRTSDGFIAVPLAVDEGTLGVLAFGYSGPLNDADVVFLEAAASHVAQTLSRVRLSEALARRADEALAAARRERRRSSQFEFIAAVTEAAVTALDHRELMHGVAAAAVPTLGDWCSLHFAPGPGKSIETVVAHADPGRQAWAHELARSFPLDPTQRRGVAAVLLSGQAQRTTWPTVVDRVEPTDHDLTPLEVEALAGDALPASVIVVPIETKRRVIGALRAVRTGAAGEHDHDDISLAETVAGRIADALDNLWLTEQHRQISVVLQEALLPPALPTIEHLDIAATYLPAGPANNVGGDFYDLFALDATSSALFIGDACGTGPNAAALTSIARHTARAAVRHGYGHRDVLEWVNQAVKHSDRNLHCTACYATIDQPTEPGAPITVRVACGGHPLPLHTTADRRTSLIGAPGTLLGIFDDITVSVEEAELHPGDTMIFYTDGITDLPAPYGRNEAELTSFISSLPRGLDARQIADAICADLAERVPDSHRHDDVALLVVRDARPVG